jgi:hypothetical protein
MIVGPVKGRGRKLKRLLTYIRLVLCLVGTLIPLSAWSQDSDVPHIVKRYNIFFRINSPVIDPQFQSNERAIQQMKEALTAVGVKVLPETYVCSGKGFLGGKHPSEEELKGAAKWAKACAAKVSE